MNDAVDKFLQGQVLVSYGILCKLVVEDSFQPGQIATANGNDDLNVILKSLEDVDEATATEAAHMLQHAGKSLLDDSSQADIRNAASQTRRKVQ